MQLSLSYTKCIGWFMFLLTCSSFTGKMDRVSRLMEVHERLNVLKTSPDLPVNYFVLNLLVNLLPVPLARLALCTHGVTMVASNMPG